MGTDGVILDLEDAVSPRDKPTARDNVAQWIEANPDARERVLVRINDATTPWFAAHLDLLARHGIRLVMLPKAESADEIDIVRAVLAAEGRIVPLIETAKGIGNLEGVASAAGIPRLAFGTLDYGVDLARPAPFSTGREPEDARDQARPKI